MAAEQQMMQAQSQPSHLTPFLNSRNEGNKQDNYSEANDEMTQTGRDMIKKAKENCKTSFYKFIFRFK